MMKQHSLYLLPLYLLPPTPNQEDTMFADSDPIADWLENNSVSSFVDDDAWWLLQPHTTSSSTSDQSKHHQPLITKKRKPTTKGGKPTTCNKNDRWAEQLLNPCAAAITAGNHPRVRHLLVVLRELASPTGDANYRLAAYGLQALTHHYRFSNTMSMSMSMSIPHFPIINFSTVKPKFFQQSLINFNDINPWFTIPNHIANNSILQVLSDYDPDSRSNLHILDIGVSHGFQWPTLLEALSRRRRPPPLVRITVVGPTPDSDITQIPFASSPLGYNFIPNILRLANEYKINLNINKLDNCTLQNLNPQIIKSSPEEILIVCAQFRLNYNNVMNHPDELLKAMRNLEPKGVILNDNNVDCSSSCSLETGFVRKVDNLWCFLDSTSVAFKGRDMEERKMMEGEASKALLMNNNNINSMTCEKWEERMIGMGFERYVFEEDVMDGARALLRKYDSNWDLRADQLFWKAQPVLFCSLWKPNHANSK